MRGSIRLVTVKDVIVGIFFASFVVDSIIER